MLQQIQDDEKFNAVSHFIAMVLSAVGSCYLLYRAVLIGETLPFVAFVVYAMSSVGLFFISTVYHSSEGDKRRIYQRMDYMGIYLKIAGNYTPYTVLFLSGTDLILVLGTVWILAFVGICFELLFKVRKKNLALVLYCVMASSILLAAAHFVQKVSFLNLTLIGVGYLSYAIGVYFYLNDHRMRYGHEIWHVCVICGSFFQYLPLAIYLT